LTGLWSGGFLPTDFAEDPKDESGMRHTLVFGVAFCVGLLASLPLLPVRFPRQVIPLAYALAAGAIVDAKQPSKERIFKSALYRQHSAWRVMGVTLVLLLALLLVVLPYLFLLDVTGLVHS
jgi:hypothetical protein